MDRAQKFRALSSRRRRRRVILVKREITMTKSEIAIRAEPS